MLIDVLKNRSPGEDLQVCSLVEKVKPLELAGQQSSSKDGTLFNTAMVESIAQAK